MTDKIVLVHTLSALVGLFDRLASDIIPGVETKHIVDEPLLECIRLRGGLTSTDAGRLWDHIQIAEAIQARAVLFTCSTLSPLLDNLRPLTALPLVKIDEAMVARAVQAGPHLGVLATNLMALDSVRDSLQEQIIRSGKEINCEFMLVEGAYSALLNGNIDEHHNLVKRAAIELSAHVNGVILAQASMAEVAETIPDQERPVPIITSPRLALEQVKSHLKDLGWG